MINALISGLCVAVPTIISTIVVNNKNSALIYVIYVEETKDKKILKMLEKSLEYQKKIKDNNKQQTISAFF